MSIIASFQWFYTNKIDGYIIFPIKFIDSWYNAHTTDSASSDSSCKATGVSEFSNNHIVSRPIDNENFVLVIGY